MKKNIEKSVLKVMEKVIGMKVKKNNEMWPPICCGLVHQPKRPVREEKSNLQNTTHSL